MVSLFRRAFARRRRTTVTREELNVLQLVLCGDDPRYRQIRGQLERPGMIEREYPGLGRFRIGPTSTTDALSFPLEVERLESEWLRVHDLSSGRDLEFRVVVGRHGFLRGLEGRTVDGGEWPRSWSVEPLSSATPCRETLALPSAEDAAAFRSSAMSHLEAWLGVSIAGAAELWPPATGAAISAREQQIGGRFAPQYRDLLAITDGATISGVRVLGHRDAYQIENATLPALVVAWDADNDEDFVVVLSLDGQDDTPYRIDVHDTEAIPRAMAADLRQYLCLLAMG